VAQHSGEGHAHALDVVVAGLVAEHDARGTLHRGDGPYVAPKPQPGTLRFPAKAVRLPKGVLLVADAGHHSIVELEPNGSTLRRRIGSGDRGLVDGGPAKARFSEPNGVCLLPPEVAAQVGYDVVVADTVNHALRGVRLADGYVTTIAGTGRQWMQGDAQPTGASPFVALSSPWDVVWYQGWDAVAVAMAGIHQLWSFDPVESSLRVRAGTTNEGLVDGVAQQAWLAQPSGLAADGQTLWFADAETSSLRRLHNDVVHTAVGRGLFDFGHLDGTAGDALLQHPLGCAVLGDGSVAVADTYNGAVRRFDPVSQTVTTLSDGLAEPSGLVVDAEHLVVVESAAHRLTRVRLPDVATVRQGEAQRTHRPSMPLRSGTVTLEVVFAPPGGQQLDDRFGPSTHLVVSSTPPHLLRSGAGAGTELVRPLVIDAAVRAGVIHVSARAASCDVAGVEHPACHVHQQDWGVPVVVSETGPGTLRLVLAGPTEAPGSP